MTDDPVSRSTRGVYGSSVASEWSGLGPQTLRLNQRRGSLTRDRHRPALGTTATRA